jgi:hypothetical protein
MHAIDLSILIACEPDNGSLHYYSSGQKHSTFSTKRALDNRGEWLALPLLDESPTPGFLPAILARQDRFSLPLS